MMSADLSMPAAGGLAAAMLLYAGTSLFVTGPIIADRTIEKSGWTNSCTSRLRLAVTPAPSIDLPKLDCKTVLGTIYGRDGAAFCARHGETLALPLSMLETLSARPAAIARERAAKQAAAAGSACACAAVTVIESRRVEFALYAGSARLITPPQIRNLDGELGRALSSPVCRVEG